MKRMNWWLSALVVLCIGCGGGGIDLGEYSSRIGEVTPSGIKLGGVFHYNESAEPRSLDPVRTGESSATAVVSQIYDGLVKFDSNLNLEPGLAERWDISDDGLEFTFYLRQGIRFHDDECFPDGIGREMTAADVNYSLHRVCDPSTMTTGAWIFTDLVEGAQAFNEGTADSISGFEVIDDYTFKIRLMKKSSLLLYRLAMTYSFITAPEAVEHYGADFFQNPVGTGPFRFVDWNTRQYIGMVRNEHYWKTDADGVQLPYLDAAIMTFVPDFKIEFIEFDRGNLDRLRSIHEDLWTNIIDENRELRPEFDHYQLLTQELLVTQYYGFNLEKEPFKDNKALRQAFNYAIDRDSIIEFVLNGRGVPSTGVVPGSMPGHESITTPYTFDLEKARALMVEAGYPNGEGLPPITLDLNSGGTTNESIAEAVQNQLRQIGVSVDLNVVEWAQHLENIDQGNSQFFRLGWIADYPDPENFLALQWSENFAPLGPNYSRYSNPEFDALFEQARATLDPVERDRLYQQAEVIAFEDAPWLFIFNTKRYTLVQPYVRNYVLNTQEIPILYEVWLDQPLPGEEAAG